jgi:hypothetical protein
MTDQEYLDWLKDSNDYAVLVRKGNEQWVGIKRLMFHWTMHVGRLHDMIGHDERFCYQTFDLAATALTDWMVREFEDEPENWHRHPNTSRRRPDGDPTREYLAD